MHGAESKIKSMEHDQYPIPSTKTLLARGWKRRCPQCGKGPAFRHWCKVRKECPECGLQYLENQGDVFGFIVLIDRVVFLIPLVVIFFLLPHEENSISRYIWGGLLVILLVYTFPHRLGIGLGIDYRLRRETGDLAEKSKSTAP